MSAAIRKNCQLLMLVGRVNFIFLMNLLCVLFQAYSGTGYDARVAYISGFSGSNGEQIQ